MNNIKIYLSKIKNKKLHIKKKIQLCIFKKTKIDIVVHSTVKFPGDNRRNTYPTLEHLLLRMSQDESSNETAVTPSPHSNSSFIHEMQWVP